MMRALLLILGMILAAPAVAQTAKVTSGEHADFTRLVVELPVAAEWRLGRTDAGYEFVVAGQPGLRFDLTAVWDRIPRTRLSGLWADPEDGALELSLACACHAFPFEYQPGTVVIDLRPGPAPPGSVFEASLDGRPVPALADAQPSVAPVPDRGGYDWLARTGPVPTAADAQTGLALPLATGSVSLGPLREALLLELGRGAAEGVVDMTLPGRRDAPDDRPAADLPWSQITIGEVPGVTAGSALVGPGDMLADGAACIPDESLAIADWGGEGAVAVQIADARAGLMGEFDVPDPDAVKRAVRHHLHLGFGAEALQYLALVETPGADGDLAIYASLARILDAEEDAASPFVGMLGCDGAAALWSALLHVRLPTGPAVNVPAVLRSFAALPPHLRQHLGPGLADRFLAVGNTEAARFVRDATARVNGIADRELALVDARVGLGEGRLDDAELHAEAALAGGGPAGIDAVLTLVEARFRKLDPAGTDLSATVGSYLAEAEGTASEADLRRAFALALALAGQSREALAALALSPQTEADVWRVIAARATDADLVELAVRPAGSPPPAVATDTAFDIASRLVSLGFADSALAWLGPTGADASPAWRLVAAEAELARGDARAARDLTVGLDDPKAPRIAAEALVRLGAIGPAAEAWREAGDTGAADRLKIWNRDWADVARTGATPWQAAAALATADGAALPKGGLLAQGTAVADDSRAARETIAALLAAVPIPQATPVTR